MRITIFIMIAMYILRAVSVYATESDDQYIEGIADLPLHEGFTLQDEPSIFDSPEGRIIEANYVSSQATLEQVLSYYQIMLPQLGWKKLRNGSYQREMEELTIEANTLLNNKIGLSVQLKPIKALE